MSSVPTYTFLSWVRQGLAATGVGWQRTEGRLTLGVTAKVNDDPNVAQVSVKLYGPGDIGGIDPRQVVRTEPRHLTSSFEPNYFPFIEFDRPDFPWLFSPDPASGQRLAPWLCLVVMPADQATLVQGRPLPVLTCPRGELPDLAEAWAWVHGQVTWTPPESNGEEDLKNTLRSDQLKTVSRLLCPRRLQPGVSYVACVVPTFDVGVQAGLGKKDLDFGSDGAPLKPAWSASDPPNTMITLPVYYSWQFTTGAVGDFESFVSRIKVWQPGAEAGQSNLELDVSRPGWGLAETEDDSLTLDGVLRVPCPDCATLGPWREADLRRALNPSQPTLTPPIYGGLQAGVTAVPASDAQPVWLRQLNLNPCFRVAAGLGVRIIQAMQEDFMAEAWDQAADARKANQITQRAQTAVHVGSSAYTNRFKTLQPDQLLQMTAPLHSQVTPPAPATMLAAFGSAPTLQAVAQATLPGAALTGAYRRIAGPRSALARRSLPAEELVVRPAVSRLDKVTFPSTLKPASRSTIVSGLNAFFQETPFPSSTNVPDDRAALLTALEASDQSPADFKPIDGEAPLPTGAIGTDTDEAGAFRRAAQTHLHRHVSPAPASSPRMLATVAAWNTLSSASGAISSIIDPWSSVVQDARDQAQAAGVELDANAPLATQLIEPRFKLSMSRLFKTLFAQFMLPNAGRMPAESVAVLETNDAFVAAFMVGLNHEMSRELAWREFPADLSGTYFQTFWEHVGGGDDKVDMPAIKKWKPGDDLSVPIGEATGGLLVLLIRGDLLRRFPTVTICAVKAADATTLGTERRYPVILGRLEPDITYLGFDLSPEAAVADPGWFFLIEQQPTEPRFGLDESDKAISQPPTEEKGWQSLSWGHLLFDQDVRSLDKLGYIGLGGKLLKDLKIGDDTWGADAATMAKITLQKPYGVAIHASLWVPEERRRP